MAKKLYRVRTGRHYGAHNQYGPGDTLELDENVAMHALDLLEEVSFAAPSYSPAKIEKVADVTEASDEPIEPIVETTDDEKTVTTKQTKKTLRSKTQ